jgi:hypothetical protein
VATSPTASRRRTSRCWDRRNAGGGPVYSLAGPDSTPYREVDQNVVGDRERAPSAGFEPTASGLRARRHHRFDHEGVETPAAGLEPALSRVTTARLPNSTTPERDRRRQQDSNLRAVVAAYALATRCLSSSAMPPSKRKERESNPQGLDSPPVFGTGYRADGSPSEKK